MKITKKKIVIAAVFVIAVGTAAYAFTSKKEPVGLTVMTSPITRGEIRETISVKAPLEGKETIEVVSKLHHEIVKIYVQEGDTVKKGQVLAELDTSEIEKEIQSKENEIALMKIQLSETNTTGNKNYQIQKKQLDEKLDKSQKEYEKAVAERDDAKKEYENNKILYASGGVSKDTLDEKKLAYENAERAVATYNTEDGKVVAEPSELAELEKTREVDNEESLQKSIDNAVFELQRKKEDLEDCVIKSTIDGTVTRVNCKVGRFADETDDDKPMFVIENIENLQMKVDISEYDISKIQLGQKAEISADILKGKVAQGQVARISPTGEEKSGTTERVIPIVIDVDRSSSEDLIAGINAKAVVEIAKNENALFVPAECIYDNGDQTYSVYRVNENNQIEILPVELGIEDDLNIEIISESLKEGDRVINSPDMSMTEGMSVIVQGE